ncbi:MAG: O-antigen ligase family protein [Pyrinomonadaceae bacterium]|nr:O-antigen ligase family protein [Pyrinomonadaceae bacterium]
MPIRKDNFEHPKFGSRSLSQKSDGNEFAFGASKNKSETNSFQSQQNSGANAYKLDKNGDKRNKSEFSTLRRKSSSTSKSKLPNIFHHLDERARKFVARFRKVEKTKPEQAVQTNENIEFSEIQSSQTIENTSVRATKKKRETILKPENWIARNGHSLTYAFLFAFTFVLYFRPYELVPGMSGFSSIALILAIATFVVFVPTQYLVEGSLTATPPEVVHVLLLLLLGFLTIPIARDPLEAWNTFSDTFVKAVFIFIVIVNVVRTRARLFQLMWLAIAIGVYISIDILNNYSAGVLNVEEYRTMANIKGMFGNPNAQAMHLVSVTPIALVFAFIFRNYVLRFLCVATAILFVAANILTYSRGGFLGLLVGGMILMWKLGRNSRVKTMAASGIFAAAVMILAPGNYGIRVLAIFIPGLDPNGSSTERSNLLQTSIIVTLRNPWGIGMGNFPLVNPRALVTHNSYTQVSAEMGVLALIVYMLFIIVPIMRLGKIEAQLYDNKHYAWMYYLSIGLQAGIISYAVSSFFDSAAYQWFLYYLIAYAVLLRRIYQLEREKNEKPETFGIKDLTPNTAK